MKLKLLIVVILSSILLAGITIAVDEDDKWHITGKVVDQYGNLVEGALIQLCGCDPAPDRTSCHRFAEGYDPDGIFEFNERTSFWSSDPSGIGVKATKFYDGMSYLSKGWYFGFTPGEDVDIEIRLGYRYTPEDGYVEHPEYLNAPNK